tara:strand:- start:366 stop:794 length:429 start_codon:yes stop_codon:yes gene_type:complete
MPKVRDEVLVEFIRSRIYADKKIMAPKAYEVYKSSSPEIWGNHEVLSKKRFKELFYRIKREDKDKGLSFNFSEFDESLFDESLFNKTNYKPDKLRIVFQKAIGILSRHFLDHEVTLDMLNINSPQKTYVITVKPKEVNNAKS